MRYGIVIERAEGNYSAFVPDLPGCGAGLRPASGSGRADRRPVP